MKKATIIFTLWFIFINHSFAQNYDVNQLKVVAKIWGDSYLFHPAITQENQAIQWEKQLIDFLPMLKNTEYSTDEYIQIINDNLLSYLGDSFTLLLAHNENNKPIYDINTNSSFDYIRISEDYFENVGKLIEIDSIITDRNSTIPLVIDIRINNELNIDYHTYNFFDYFVSMMIDQPIIFSPLVSREHFGWDENNEWWLYEQRWKVISKDLDIISNGKLLPYKDYNSYFTQHNIGINTENSATITRPIVFLSNKTSDSYYGHLLSDVRINRRNTFIVKERTGKVVISKNSHLKKYSFPYYDFIINPVYNISNNKSGLIHDLICDRITEAEILAFINSDKQKLIDNRADFSFNISPVKYFSTQSSLSIEEKILGIIKIYTVIKYFHIDRDKIVDSWDECLDKYLRLVQNTNSDKEYFELIQTMMCILNDSHVFVEHESMLDFSSLFVVPIMFEWIENRAIVTSYAPELENIVKLGDEIVSIDSKTICETIEQKRVNVPHSNEQSLISIAVTPANFTGTAGSQAAIEIKRGDHSQTINLERNTMIFNLLNGGTIQRKTINIFDNNIGYLNLANIATPQDLKTGIEQIKNTNRLIIDMRNSYPIISFYDLLQIFCNKKTAIRKDEVPIVSAFSTTSLQYSTSWSLPSEDNTYSKPVIVLIDKTMMSRPEDIAIALKSFDNIKFVGEQTQGTDGEMTKIYLPGNGSVSFTGQLIKFGDGTNFQGVGIIPDIFVEKTINGVINGEDEILKAAINIIGKL